MTTAPIIPFPDLLGRRDAEHGAWEVEAVPMQPGVAWTNIVDRKMHAPGGDSDQERAVRAHEMMHAKCSPADEWPKWIARGIASQEALTAVEEFRVNTLCLRAGFDTVKTALTDGSEKVTGEAFAIRGDWTGAVYATAAFAGTARIKPFLAGVRKTNPDWAKSLRALNDRLVALAKRVQTFDLGSTAVDRRSGLAPLGFRHTENWAMLVDQVARPPKAADADPDDDDPRRAAVAVDRRGAKITETDTDAPISPEAIKRASGAKGADVGGWWDDLRVERCPMPRQAPGGLGRKRRPADRGRHPRRIHRMLVDPQRRVFDAVKRGNGGVVLIDGSGSMSFTEKDIMQIVEAAPGATVAIYSSNGDKSKPNLYVVADKGRLIDTLPDREVGNGVDGPAIEWAIAQRQHPQAPVVWVTDGGCHGPGQGYSDQLGVDCLNRALDHKVIVRPNVDAAVVALTSLARGARRVPRWLPYWWRKSWTDVMGTRLPLNEIAL